MTNLAIFAPSIARSVEEKEKWRRAVMRFAAFVMSKVETNKRNNTRKKREIEREIQSAVQI